MNSEIARFVHALSAELVERGHWFNLMVTNESVKTEQAVIDDLPRLSPFGVLKFPTQIAYEHDVRARLREAGIPCVVINDFWADCSLDHHVAYDEQAGMKMAVDHLVELGHERIGLLDSHISPRVRAINAYRDALRSHGLPADEKLMLLGDPSQIPALDRLYHKGGINPTALITVYDVIAVRVVAGLRQIGLRVPEDVSVANTNGEPLAMGHVDFTTVVLPDQKIIRCALEILETWTEGAPVRHEIITPGFHVGRSTAPCAE
jgi:DNA-binding LacI/PurR family transcriptional regulator